MLIQISSQFPTFDIIKAKMNTETQVQKANDTLELQMMLLTLHDNEKTVFPLQEYVCKLKNPINQDFLKSTRTRSQETTKKSIRINCAKKSFDDMISFKDLAKRKPYKIHPVNKTNDTISSISFKTKNRENEFARNFFMNYKFEDSFTIQHGFDDSRMEVNEGKENKKISFILNQSKSKSNTRTINNVSCYIRPKMMSQIKEESDSSTLKSLIQINGICLNRILKNFISVSPSKSDLKRFLNNMDLTMNIQGCYDTNLNDLDKLHLEHLKKYLNPFSTKINIEKIPNTTANFLEFLQKLRDTENQVEFFLLPLVSDLLKNENGLNLKEIVRCHKKEFPVLHETNPTGLIHYNVVSFDDFFIDAKTSTKFTDKIIEIYKFPRFLVIQSIYPLTEIFAKVLEFFVMQYRQSKINNLTDLLARNKTTIFDFETVDAHSSSIFNIESISKMLEELKNVNVKSNLDFSFAFNFNDKKVNFSFPPKNELCLLESGKQCYKLFEKLTYEELLFLVSSMASERTLIFVSKKQNTISRAISTLIALFKPLMWVYPLIYSVPNECFEVLSSPVPVIVGVQNDIKLFMKDFENKLDFHNPKNSVAKNFVLIFLDEGIFHCHCSLPEGNFLSSNLEFLKKFES